jgi:hypothetical protein
LKIKMVPFSLSPPRHFVSSCNLGIPSRRSGLNRGPTRRKQDRHHVTD